MKRGNRPRRLESRPAGGGRSASPVLPWAVPTALLGHRWARNRNAARSHDDTCQSFLHIGSQGRIQRKIPAGKRFSRSSKHRWWHAARLPEPSCSDSLRHTDPDRRSSLAMPAAIAAQNRRCSSRPATSGRPGDNNGARPDRSERRFRLIIATSFGRVLRRPLESALVAAIGMMKQAGTGATLVNRHPKRVDRQVLWHGFTHRPADNPPRKQVENHGHIEPAFRCRNIGDVGQPDLVRGIRGELSIKKIRRY
jgi:hypothetical protein